MSSLSASGSSTGPSHYANNSAAAGQASRGHQHPGRQAALASALETIGVDDTTASSVLSQVREAVETAKSGSSSGNVDRSAVRSAIADVLQENGIDPAEVRNAIRDSRQISKAEASGEAEHAGGPRRGGRPQGPPSRAHSKEGNLGSIESALLASNLEETEVEDLLSQIFEATSSLSSDKATKPSSESIQQTLTEVLEENGVDVERFKESLQGEIGGRGSFFNRAA